MQERRQVLGTGSVEAFAATLRFFRETAGMSQSRLAAAAGYDHSYVSRLESSSRMPTRDAVLNLANAMTLEDQDRDSLLASAGFMPLRVENLLSAEPVVGEVLSLLQNHAVPSDVRDDLRNAVAMAVRQAQRATPEWDLLGAAHATVAAD